MWRLHVHHALVLVLGLCACSAPSPQPARELAKPELMHGEVPVAAFVAKAAVAAPTGVLVYVGASWCEPCQRFHEALTRGELDGLLRGMRVVEYDLDRHKAELASAGYTSRLIPLFALPNADGTCSTRTISGSIKGERALPDNLLPRLRALLASRR